MCPHQISKHELPDRIGSGETNTIPAILLAKLALDEDFHGQGLGRQLLVDAVTRAVSAVDIVGGRYIVIDAIDEEAAGFYEHFGLRKGSLNGASIGDEGERRKGVAPQECQ